MFDVFEAFINTDNIQVFANAATDYIMCLMKFVKGLGSYHSLRVSVLFVPTCSVLDDNILYYDFLRDVCSVCRRGGL